MVRRLGTAIVGAGILFVVLAAGGGPAATAGEAAGAPDKSGCCSHHDGVCGCNAASHAIMCCDGSASPKCGC